MHRRSDPRVADDAGTERRFRISAASLLWVAAGLNVALLIYTVTFGAELNEGREGGQLLWTSVSLFLLFQVSRGSRFSWWLLVALGGFDLLILVVGTIAVDPYVIGLGVLSALELVVLLSPPVRAHIRAR